MRVRALAAAVAGSAAVLTAAWHVGATQTGSPTAPIPMPGAATAPAPALRTVAMRTGAAHARAGERRFTGVVVRTRFGPMQVAIAMRGGRLVRVWALRLTDRYGRSVRASTRAAPVLGRQALEAGSARIVGVTGATYTSDGYRRSLQSALDEAAGG